ncbi:hypothetical protein FJZ19_05305 [Candidatus Pacearchaeota archaeon]|nr:hypothetical protein [Candidatus Pacearchaeota archaeon]
MKTTIRNVKSRLQELAMDAANGCPTVVRDVLKEAKKLTRQYPQFRRYLKIIKNIEGEYT